MDGIKLFLRHKNVAGSREAFVNTTPYDNRYGFWAVVQAVHSEDCCVDVLTDLGQELHNVQVASMQWVCTNNEKNFLSGSRDLPQVNSYVFCICPQGDITSSFVLCSGFMRDCDKHKQFMQKNKNNIIEKIDSAGYHLTKDIDTGTVKISNDTSDKNAGDICAQLNCDTKGSEKAFVKVYDSTIDMNKESIDIKSKTLNFCGDDNGGLVIAKELQTQLAKLTARVDGIINTLNIATPTASMDGGASLMTVIKSSLSSIVDKENFSNIASNTVMHGTKTT